MQSYWDTCKHLVFVSYTVLDWPFFFVLPTMLGEILTALWTVSTWWYRDVLSASCFAVARSHLWLCMKRIEKVFTVCDVHETCLCFRWIPKIYRSMGFNSRALALSRSDIFWWFVFQWLVPKKKPCSSIFSSSFCATGLMLLDVADSYCWVVHSNLWLCRQDLSNVRMWLESKRPTTEISLKLIYIYI